MQYVNFVYGDDDECTLHTAPVAVEDAEYLARVVETLRPLSDEDYMDGPAVVLQTLAKYSYVLEGSTLYWCVEWEPGFLVVRFAPDEPLAWTAIRSPNPGFAGREATEEEWDAFDEDAENPQYNLIFVPWDAQFDEQDREWGAFVPAADDVESRFEKALERVNALGEVLEGRLGDDEKAHEAWCEQCKANLEAWCGEGLRLS